MFRASCDWFAGLPFIDVYSLFAVGLSQAEVFCKVQLSFCEIVLQNAPNRLDPATGLCGPGRTGRKRGATE